MKTCPSTFGFSPKANAWLVIEFHRFKLIISSYLFNTSPQLAIPTYFKLNILYKLNQQAFFIWYSFRNSDSLPAKAAGNGDEGAFAIA
jgi:hypothetical protein